LNARYAWDLQHQYLEPSHLTRGLRSALEELQLTDALHLLLAEEQVLAYRYYGTRFDCGSKLGYLKATVEFALRHPEIGPSFDTYLRNYIAQLAA
jgi:UTP--glucose-1-phosphate uridylyltransferase